MLPDKPLRSARLRRQSISVLRHSPSIAPFVCSARRLWRYSQSGPGRELNFQQHAPRREHGEVYVLHFGHNTSGAGDWPVQGDQPRGHHHYLLHSDPFTPKPCRQEDLCTGTPIQVSAYRQQVVNNLLTGFTTAHVNTISSLSPFELHRRHYQLRQLGKLCRTNYTGHVNASAPPSGWFGGYAVGMK
jgi:hypothetical protein